MHITSTLTTLLTAAAVAVASPGGWNGYNGGFCGLTQANINDLITGYSKSWPSPQLAQMIPIVTLVCRSISRHLTYTSFTNKLPQPTSSPTPAAPNSTPPPTAS